MKAEASVIREVLADSPEGLGLQLMQPEQVDEGLRLENWIEPS